MANLGRTQRNPEQEHFAQVAQQWNVSWVRNLLRESTSKPEMLAIDATGIDSWQRSRDYERQIGAAYMLYAKADILIDTESKLVFEKMQTQRKKEYC